MGKTAGKPGEMRYTGITTDEKGKETGESFRDGRNREFIQKKGEGTPKMVTQPASKPAPKKFAKGGSVRGDGCATKGKTKGRMV